MSKLSKLGAPARMSPRQHAVQGLRKLIAGGEWRGGERLPAENTLADQLSVSRSTLRVALDQLEREGLVRRKKNCGCIVAESPAGSNALMARTLVFLTNLMPATSPDVFSGRSDAVHSGVMAMTGRRQMNLLSVNIHPIDEQGIGNVLASQPCGIMLTLWTHEAGEDGLCHRLQHSGIPVAVLGENVSAAAFDQVSSDHAGGTHDLAAFLIGRGRRRILRVWNAPEKDAVTQARDAGFEHAMAEAGLPVIPALRLDVPARVPEDHAVFLQRMRYFAGHLVEHLQGAAPVDAIMAGSDYDFFPVAAACRLFGVGDKIAITGYDNRWQDAPERQWEPAVPAATVDKDNHRIGEELVTLLLERIAGTLPPERQRRLIPQRLVVG